MERAPAARTPPLTAAHLPTLDGVRGIAVLAVMVLHFSVMQPVSMLDTGFLRLAELGWAGVDLFFVLSGFLITGILIDSREGAGYFRNFYARRALRIFPLYYAFLIAIFWVLPAITGADVGPFGPKLWMLTYLGNFLFSFGGWEAVPGHTTHLWSLAIEEQFYFIWPLVVYLASRRTLMRICIGAIVAGWLFRAVFAVLWENGILGYALLPARMDALAMGGLIAAMVREEGWAERFRTWIRPLALGASALLVLTAVVSPLLTPGQGLFPPLAPHVQLLGFPAVDLLSVALVAYAVLPGPGRGRTLLLNERLRRFGKYSYALYVLHIPLRNLLVERIFPGGNLPTVAGSAIPAQLAVLVGAVALTYAVAFTSWHLFERHFLGLKRHFEWRPVTTEAVPRVG